MLSEDASEDTFATLPNHILEDIVFALDEPSVKALLQVNKRLYFLITHLLTRDCDAGKRFPRLALFPLISSMEVQLRQSLARKYTPIGKKSETMIRSKIATERRELMTDIFQSMQMLESQLRLLTHNPPK